MAQLHKEEEVKSELQNPAQLHGAEKGDGKDHKPNFMTRLVDTIKNKHYEHQRKKGKGKGDSADDGEEAEGIEDDEGQNLHHPTSTSAAGAQDLPDVPLHKVADNPVTREAGIAGLSLDSNKSSDGEAAETVHTAGGDVKPALFDSVMQPEAIEVPAIGHRGSDEVKSRVPPAVPEESNLTTSSPASDPKFAGALDPLVKPGESSFASALDPLVQTKTTQAGTGPVSAESQQDAAQGGYLPTSVTSTAGKVYEKAAGVASYLFVGQKGEGAEKQSTRDADLGAGVGEQKAEGAEAHGDKLAEEHAVAAPTLAQRTYEQVAGTASYLKEGAAARLGYGTAAKEGTAKEGTDEGAAEIADVLSQPPFVEDQQKAPAQGYYGSVVGTVKAVRDAAAARLGYASTEQEATADYLKDLKEEDKSAKVVSEGGGHIGTEKFEDAMHDRFKLDDVAVVDEGTAKISDVLAEPCFAEEKHEAPPASPKNFYENMVDSVKAAAANFGQPPKQKDDKNASLVTEGGGHLATENFEEEMHNRFPLGESDAPTGTTGKAGTLWQQPSS